MHPLMIENFMRIYYPKLHSETCCFQPKISLMKVLQDGNPKEEATMARTTLFAIHHVVSAQKDWQIKRTDDVFLFRGGKIYLLANLATNFETEIEFEKNDHGYRLSSSMIIFNYYEKSKSSGQSYLECTVPQKKWQPMKLQLSVETIPEGDDPEEIRKELVGEKFPINIAYMSLHSAKRDANMNILIWGEYIAQTLRDSGKKITAEFYTKNYFRGFVRFNPESCKIY